MQKFNRIITIVLDSVGIGQCPDSDQFGDYGVNTLGNISQTVGLEVPNMQQLGLGNISYIKTVPPVAHPLANFGKMQEVGNGKDTMTGHWEMMGVTLHDGFKQYVKEGFPQELVDEFVSRVGRGVLANKEANGMQVIDEFYEEHEQTGKFILYTSVDSTWQMAAREDIIPVEELYQACEVARELTKEPKYNVARVIARPFIGKKGEVVRTANRHDYALDPFETTVMEKLVNNNLESVAIGKISDIFNGVGVSKQIKTKDNMDGVDKTIEELKQDYSGFIFTNLVEFDSVYGHPRNTQGYRDALEDFDKRLPEIIKNLKDDDLLIITADHGNDPTYKGNDHTREYVPVLAYSKQLKGDHLIPQRTTFEDLGETICDNFGLASTINGKSFLGDLV